MFTHPRAVRGADGKTAFVTPTWDAYPLYFVKSIQVVRDGLFIPYGFHPLTHTSSSGLPVSCSFP